jgi:hypothetical protein
VESGDIKNYGPAGVAVNREAGDIPCGLEAGSAVAIPVQS